MPGAIRPQPSPNTPLISGARHMAATFHPWATGRPLIGATTNHATAVAPTAPIASAERIRSRSERMRSVASRITMPQRPPQKAALKTAGIPSGPTGAIRKGGLGTTP
jgi:hypothetical protein